MHLCIPSTHFYSFSSTSEVTLELASLVWYFIVCIGLVKSDTLVQ